MPAWIEKRRKRLEPELRESYSPKKAKQVAYALATMQSHKVGKTPKSYGTTEGRREARQKFDKPKKEYQKTAMWSAYWDEIVRLSVKEAAL